MNFGIVDECFGPDFVLEIVKKGSVVLYLVDCIQYLVVGNASAAGISYVVADTELVVEISLVERLLSSVRD